MAPRKNYNPEQMQQAVEAVSKGEKVAAAAAKYGVPRITLHNKVTGISPLVCSMGPTTYLSPEDEHILEKWIIDMNNKHIPINKEELLDSVQRIITDKNLSTPFNQNRPGKKWYQLFLKRHPNISERMAQNLTMARDNVSQNDIENWFKEVEEYLTQNDMMTVLDDPTRVFNTDESAFFLSPKPGKVLAQRGEKHVYTSSGDEKDNLTVLITGNAAGQLAPPMVVFSYERIPATIASKFPHDWAIGKSQTGWMCGSTFYEYIANIFHPWLLKQTIKTPVLFFLDGHKSHLTLHLSNFCAENGIELVTLYPNSTHIMQPMDLAVFKPLKSSWKKAVSDWKMQNLGQNLRKENFAPVLKTAIQTLTEDTIRNGFRAAGLCPFGPSYIDFTKIKSNRPQQDNMVPQNSFKLLHQLEKEMTKIFRREKLDLFKELYYKDRNELNERLPPEDTSLYVIWASMKNKSSGEQTLDAEPTAPETVVNNRDINSVNDKEPTVDTVTADRITELPDATTILNDSIKVPCTSQKSPAVSQREKEIPCHNDKANNKTLLVTFNEMEHHRINEVHETPLKNLTQEISNKDNVLVTPVTEKTPRGEIVAANVSYFGVSKENTATIVQPQKSLGIKSNMIIPSPFKINLFWPDEDETQKGKKRRLKEEIPSVITSPAWIKYYENKESQKRQKLEEKERKAKERIAKKLLKDNLVKQKKNKKAEKKEKLLTHNDTSSDETDAEVQYAESDDSISESTYLNKFRKTSDENCASSDSDGLPIAKLQPMGKKLSKGVYVIVMYEGEYFPGIIENAGKGCFEVSTMSFSTGNTFRWPNKPDKIWYEEKDVVEIIEKPKMSNNRGFYTVKEMEKHLPFIL